ncbi:complement C1q-like protein 2 [Antedon mediterranea]|uniref:complement C1q-like protein 2 n=1 Tax=Antedon mediterranea TaxID=105859 RepID=UPI003AF539A8
MYTFAAAFAAVIILTVGNPIDDAEGSGTGFTRQRSAFTAKLTKSLDASYYRNRRIIFNSVLNNVGDDYNPQDGRFTTSVAGTYVFTVTLMSKYSSGSSAFGCLHKNDNEQVCVWSNGNSANEMSSNTITLNLEEGDVVDVVLKAGSNYGIHNYGEAGYCTFTGFLLYPKEDVLERLINQIHVLV